MTELQQDIAKVAVGALVDSLRAVEAEPKAIKFLTIEVELSAGKPTAARAWIERRCNVNKLLGLGGRG